MSDATLRMLISADFVIWVVIGSLVVLAATVWGAVTSRPAPIGGLLLSGGVAIALFSTREIPTMLLLGLFLLAVAGWVPRRTLAAGMATAIPGAIVVGATLLEGPPREVGVFVVVVIVISAPLVASFDENYQGRTIATQLMATQLMAISFIGAFFTIPDTEEAIVAVGMTLPFALVGLPGRIARLGGPGAFAGTGILVWVVASGSLHRPGSLILGTACFGLLIAEPAMRAVRTAHLTRTYRLLGMGGLGVGAVIAAQVAIGLTMSRVANISGSGVLVAAGAAVLVLVLAGVWSSAPVSDS